MDSYKKEELKIIIKNWVKKKYKNLVKLDIAKLQPNPFLLRALGIRENTDKAWEFRISQRIERSLVTSFGQSLLEEIVKSLGFKKANMENIDFIFHKDNFIYYIQLKSGPEGFTRPALVKTKETFEKIKSQDERNKTVIAISYGDKNQLSKIWGDEALESADIVLVGKEFWNFFFGKDTYSELLKIFEESGKEVIKEIGKKGSVYEALIEELLKKVKKDLQLE